MATRRPSAPPPTFSCNELRQSAHAMTALQGSRRNVASTCGGAWSRPGGARRKKKRTDVIEDTGIGRKRGRIGTLGRQHQNAPQDLAPRATTSLDPDDPMHNAVAAAPPSCPAGASVAMKVPRVTRTPSVTTTSIPTRTSGHHTFDTRTHNIATSKDSTLPQPHGRVYTAAHAPNRPTSHTDTDSHSAAQAEREESLPPPPPRAAAGRVNRTEEYVEPLVEVAPTYEKGEVGEPLLVRVRVRRVDDTEQADGRQDSQSPQVTRPMTDATRASATESVDEPRQRTQAPPPPSGPPPARARPYVTRPKRNADGELTEAVRLPPSDTTITSSHAADANVTHTPVGTSTSQTSHDSSATAITIVSSQRSTRTTSHQRHPDVDLRSPHTHERAEDEGLLEMRALEPCCLPMLEILQATFRSLLEALSITPVADTRERRDGILTPRPKLGGVCCRHQVIRNA